MKILKRASSLALALVLVLSLAVPVFAADSVVSYSGHKLLGFAPGSKYITTDMFDNFKNVMPGDKLTELITVENTARCCDYIKVYMRAVPHDETDNPLSPKVANSPDKTPETVATMSDFLSQLTMVVKQGDKVIYTGSPDKTEDGLTNRVLLGTLRRNKSLDLTVELYVPRELDNKYANRIGEVDWEFTIEEYNDGRDTPKTGDDTNILPYVALLAVGAAGMFVLLMVKRKKNQSN